MRLTAIGLASGCTLLALAGSASAAGYAPISCANASLPSEKTICSSYSLGQNEARMATLYQWATSFVAMGQRGAIQDDQVAFLKKRAACGADASCLHSLYQARIKALETVMDNVKSHGPF